MESSTARSDTRAFRALVAAFVVQILGRLLDLKWHSDHPEFETARDQVQAHWLVWLGTLVILVAAGWALKTDPPRGERRGYLVVLWSNVVYVVVAIVHFFQHLDHQEVDWAHVGLAVTNVGSVVGVLIVIASRLKYRATGPEA